MRRGGALRIPSLHGCGKVTQIVPEKRSLQGFCPRTGFKNLLRLESSSDSWSSLISQGCVKQKEGHKIQSCCLHMEVVENRSGLRVLPGMSTPGPEWCVVSCLTEPTSFSSASSCSSQTQEHESPGKSSPALAPAHQGVDSMSSVPSSLRAVCPGAK